MAPKPYFILFSVAMSLGAAVVLVTGGFLIDGLRRVFRQYRLARGYEKEGNWRAACYYYALVALNSEHFCESCVTRVKTLWKQYGPFDYGDIKAQLLRSPKYAQGCIQTVAEIDKLVTH
jgi:hypothetical protein